MSYETLRKAINDRFIAAWTATPMDRVVFGENHEKLNVKQGAWLRLSFNVVDNQNAEVGTEFQRALGIINVQIFTSTMDGEREAYLLVDAVSSVFQNKQFGGVTCYTVFPVRVGRRGETFQMNARVDFEYDVFS